MASTKAWQASFLHIDFYYLEPVVLSAIGFIVTLAEMVLQNTPKIVRKVKRSIGKSPTECLHVFSARTSME